MPCSFISAAYVRQSTTAGHARDPHKESILFDRRQTRFLFASACRACSAVPQRPAHYAALFPHVQTLHLDRASNAKKRRRFLQSPPIRYVAILEVPADLYVQAVWHEHIACLRADDLCTCERCTPVRCIDYSRIWVRRQHSHSEYAMSVYEHMSIGGTRPLRPFRMTRRTLVHPRTREELDDALVVFFPRGRSFTGDATLEMHLHGSPAVVRDVLHALEEMRAVLNTRNMRAATPGEFTRRAFEHGRLDLTACEALDALLHAETTQQRTLAQRAAHGYQAKLYDALHTQLVEAHAHIEAMLDFSDEEDQIDQRLWLNVYDTIQKMRTYLAAELQVDLPTGQRTYADAVIHGVRVALYGKPNAGKSSLLNRLIRRDAAIVTPFAGTTRDVIEASIEMAGFRVTLADTAGLRDTHDALEQLGIERTHAYIAGADLQVLVCTPHDLGTVPKAGRARISRSTLEAWGVHPSSPKLILINKMDECTKQPVSMDTSDGDECIVWHASVLHDRGIDTLCHDLGKLIGNMYKSNAMPLVTQARHRHLLTDVLTSLDAVLQHSRDAQPDLVVVAEELRRAANALAQVTGRMITSDAVLGEIFARFCIGK